MLYEMVMLTIIGFVTQPEIRHVGVFLTDGRCLEASERLDRKLNSLPHVEAAGSRVVFTCVELIEPAKGA